MITIRITWGLQGLKALAKHSPHFYDSVSHVLKLFLPCVEVGGNIQNTIGNPCAMEGRVGVVLTDNRLDLGKNLLLGVLVGADYVESTNALAIETHVLCEGLSDEHLEALVDEVANGPCVLVQVTTGEALVGGIEEGEQRVLLHDFADLLPVLLSGVNAGWVVSTCMQQHN